MKHAKSLGFKKMITEDNYPYQQGDCYTPKKIMAECDYVMDSAGNRVWHKKIAGDLEYFENNVNIYQEMPPLFKGEITRWASQFLRPCCTGPTK